MNMETNYNDNELELMRLQLGILKEKLSAQEVINHRLIREAMKKRLSWINWMLWSEIVALPFLTALYWGIVKDLDSAVWLMAYFLVCLVGDIVADYKINHIRPQDWAECELLDMSRRLVRMKKLRNRQAVIGFVLVVIWFAWALIEVFDTLPVSLLKYGIAVAVLTFLIFIVASLVGCTLILRAMNKSTDGVIRQIEELTNGEW